MRTPINRCRQQRSVSGVMKFAYIISIVFSLAIALVISAQFPVTKVSTQSAVEMISRHLPPDMSSNDKLRFEVAERSILLNHSVASECLQKAKQAGLGVCLVLFALSLAGLCPKKEGLPNQSVQPTVAPRATVTERGTFGENEEVPPVDERT